MKKYTKQLKMLPIKLMACGILSLTINPVSSLAQDMEGNEVYELDEFVVTNQFLFSDQVNALRTPTPVIDVPQSLSITGAKDIADRGFDSLGDIVDYTPGVSMNQGEGHRDAVVFRGAMSTADFFVDGVRDDMQYYRPLYNVEQVEILRGPNALLFGRGGSGGIINRVTKKAQIGLNFNDYTLSTDTFGANKVQIDSNVAVDDSTSFRLNAYFDNFKNHRDFSDGSGYAVNPSVKFLLDDKTTLDVSYEQIDYDRFIDRGIPSNSAGRPNDSLNDIFFGDSELNESKFEASVLRALLQHRFSDTLKGNLTASYGDYDKVYANFYANDVGTNPNDGTPTVDLSGYIDGTQRKSATLSGNLVAEYENGGVNHTILAGFDYSETSNDNNRTKATTTEVALNKSALANFSGSFGTFGDKTEAEIDVFSLYLQDEISLSENLDIVLGLRYDKIDFAVDAYDASGAISASRDQSDTKVSPRLGLVYKPEETVSYYVSYSESFLPKSGGQYASVKSTLDTVDPDEFSNLEAGVKMSISEGQSLTAAVFQMDQKFSSGGPNSSTVFTDAEIEGFELQYYAQLSDQWTINAGYSQLSGIDNVGDGGRPAELPKHSFSVWNNYKVSEKLGLGLGATYQGESTPKGWPEKAEGTVPSYVRVDAAAYYQINDNLRLQVNIENLLDKDYYPHAYGTHQFTVGAPLNATVSISGSF